MRILFDSKSTQVQVQVETGKRLNTLFDAITGQGWTYSLSTDPLTSEELEEYDVLAILTRRRATQKGFTNPFPPDTSFAYTPEEVAAIQELVSGGGGLLLISNHGPFPTAPNDNQTENDKVLANAFGVSLFPAAFMAPNSKEMKISGSSLSTDPAITSTILNGVSSIVTHNSCAIAAQPGTTATVIASIPLDAKNISPTFKDGPQGFCYALTLAYGSGNVIIAGNSGISGDPGSPFPAPGLIDAGDNKAFLLNALSYVGGASG